MRLILDTVVMVAAIRSEAGASRTLLEPVLQRKVTLLTSVPLFLEYEAVMTRSQHLAAAQLSVNDVRQLLTTVSKIAEPVPISFLWRPALPDPDDDMVLEAAVNGRADRLVTFNR